MGWRAAGCVGADCWLFWLLSLLLPFGVSPVGEVLIRAGLSQNYDTALKDMTRNYEKRSFLKPHRI